MLCLEPSGKVQSEEAKDKDHGNAGESVEVIGNGRYKSCEITFESTG